MDKPCDSFESGPAPTAGMRVEMKDEKLNNVFNPATGEDRQIGNQYPRFESNFSVKSK